MIGRLPHYTLSCVLPFMSQAGVEDYFYTESRICWWGKLNSAPNPILPLQWFKVFFLHPPPVLEIIWAGRPNAHSRSMHQKGKRGRILNRPMFHLWVGEVNKYTWSPNTSLEGFFIPYMVLVIVGLALFSLWLELLFLPRFPPSLKLVMELLLIPLQLLK